MSENERTFNELATIALRGATVAMAFQAIRASREHMHEPFNPRRFFSGLISAGGVGVLSAWILDGIHVSFHTAMIVTAISGYTGGVLLDIMSAEVPELIKAAFDGAQVWLLEGKWLRRGKNNND